MCLYDSKLDIFSAECVSHSPLALLTPGAACVTFNKNVSDTNDAVRRKSTTYIHI